jgi:MFS transporter, putative metabolite:H+ symporter
MGIVIAAFSGGSLLVGVLGNVLLPGGHWRVLFVIAFLPLLLAVAAEFCIKEPARSAEVLRLRKASSKDVRLAHRVDIDKARQATWWQLFSEDLRHQTIVMSVGGFFVNASPVFVLALSATYFTLYDHLSIAAISDSVTIEAAAALAGGLLVGLLSDYISPRNLMVVFSLAGAVAIALMARHGGTGWMFLTMGLFGFFGQGALGTWPRYIADSFPTRVRGTAQGFVFGMFFASNAFVPIVFGNMMGAGFFVATCFVAAAAAALGAVVLAFGRTVPVRAELEDITA